MQEFLQSKLPTVMKGGKITYNGFNQMMTQISKMRAAPGVNQAKSIDPETLQQLWNIHSDLKRGQNLQLGKSAGSDTVQKASFLQNVVAPGARLVGEGAAHLAAAHIPFGIGNVALAGGKNILNMRAAKKAQAEQAARINYLLGGVHQAPED